MLITVSGGWTEGEARNELDLKVKVVGADAQEVAHLESLLGDDATGKGDSTHYPTMDIKAARKVTLAEQAEAKAVADKAAADDAAAAAAKLQEVAQEQAAKDARVQGIASAAAKAAVEAVLAAEQAPVPVAPAGVPAATDGPATESK